MKGIQILTEKNKKEVKKTVEPSTQPSKAPEATVSQTPAANASQTAFLHVALASGDRTYMVRIRTDGICRQ